MGSINYNEITSQISNWIQSESNGQIQSIDEESVQMSMNIVKCLQPKNTEEVFLKLCALNLLNAAIKTDLFKDILSYELIKSTAAKLVIAIDCLKKGIISYYYHKDELCLYFEIGNIVFSFHHVPLTSEILKASFATPIKWPGIRLQRIAQPLFSQVVRLLEDDIELKAIIYKNDDEIVEDNIGTDADNFVDYNGLDTDMIPKETTMIEEFDNGSIIISDEEREQYAIDILSGVQLGDNVEINTYGILKNGRIGALNNQFIQLELAGNKHIRIKCDAISSIEFVSTANNKPFDLSFANNVLKEILIEEGLYPSSDRKSVV